MENNKYDKSQMLKTLVALVTPPFTSSEYKIESNSSSIRGFCSKYSCGISLTAQTRYNQHTNPSLYSRNSDKYLME